MMCSAVLGLTVLVAAAAAAPNNAYWNWNPSYSAQFGRLPQTFGNAPQHGTFGSRQDVGVCSLPIKKGPCKAAFDRFGFVNGVCRPFLYGGCQGNGNNFVTPQECQRACGRGRVGRGNF
ncbi:Kunitz-type serine protease inhibitor superbin-2 [Amphibalanus amphitrite]|uniref:Kunitz-type serine protease inhibitor superbin-2 n=1 Tax=Amphibalanus amphitrite TaxID=1232801 RepID=A0A6A4V7P2_AMPAM|nr:PI-stichotoxin-Hcr2j-like [Amphibalanus amphitrite]KAF0292287.1 Kunitz-type serine protease inhibitor superbin-2 [Amphibalanus amphitrite]